jgi:hypothetical protein
MNAWRTLTIQRRIDERGRFETAGRVTRHRTSVRCEGVIAHEVGSWP